MKFAYGDVFKCQNHESATTVSDSVQTSLQPPRETIHWKAVIAESDWRCFRGSAISSSHGRPQDFFPGGGQFKDDKSWRPNYDLFSRHPQSTGLHLLMHKTLYYISRGGQVPSKHFIFFEGGSCVRRRGRRAMAQWPVQACVIAQSRWETELGVRGFLFREQSWVADEIAVERWTNRRTDCDAQCELLRGQPHNRLICSVFVLQRST